MWWEDAYVHGHQDKKKLDGEALQVLGNGWLSKGQPSYAFFEGSQWVVGEVSMVFSVS